jgi:hypothetical protein
VAVPGPSRTESRDPVAAGPKKAKRAKAPPPPDTVPLPGTDARRVYDAILADSVLRPITVNPGDFSVRSADPGAYPGVNVEAEVRRAGEYAASRPTGHYADGRAFLRNWLQRRADDVARTPRPAAPVVVKPSATAPKRVEVSAEEAEAARMAFAEELKARRAAKGKVANG